jgi:hypothetical protein
MSDPKEGENGGEDGDVVDQYLQISSNEIVLPESVNGKDRYVTIEKISAETVSPLIKKDVSVDSIYEIIDRNFSYPLTAHVGLKFDSRSFSQVPAKEFDVKMKKIKVPSNYFPIGGDGLDRRYVFSNPDYPANPTTLDAVFIVDQNMNSATRALLRRNLQSFLTKLIAGYTNVRFSIWQTAASGINTIINEKTGDTINGFTHYDSYFFREVETPDSTGANQTNLYKLLDSALGATQLNPETSPNPDETIITNFFLRKSQFSITDEVGKASEASLLQSIWKNTVRKIIYFSGSTPEVMHPTTYNLLLNQAAENGIQIYYLNTDPDFSGTRTLRELATETGGAKFNLGHDSDIKLQQFCDANFYDSNKIYYGDWDGTFKTAWTDNPAWILYDIITDFNYGLGNFIDLGSVDKWSLYDIGRYCDAVDDDGRFKGVPDGKGGLEPRYTCNIIFYNKDEAYNILKDVAAIFKGIVYWNTEGFSFFADRPKDPIMYFANANIKDGAFQYTETARNKRYTAVEVVYNDRYDDYKTKMEFVEDVDGIRKYGLNPFKVNAAGCTSRSEAKRIGRYILYSSIFEADNVSFTAGIEAAYLQPGDIFGVSDEVRNVGRTFGRILAVDQSSNSIKIDGEFKAPTAEDPYGLDSGVYIHIPSGNFAVSDLNALTGSDGDFTGTLAQIRSRRQTQTRKFNIHTVSDDPYGATLTLTGDFCLQNVVTDVYAIEGRISGASYTGQTLLTGSVYDFPNHVVAGGNPRWDSLSFSDVSGVLSDFEIDIDFLGTAGTGQVIGNETNWTGNIAYSISSNSVFNINGSTALSIGTSQTYAARINAAGTVTASGAISDLNAIFSNSIYTSASDGDVIIVFTRGAQISNQFVPNSTWASFAATEIFKIGKDDTSSATANYGYACALIKGGYRVLERASKTIGEYGNVLFTYRDLLAFSRLRPYYTFVQADFGNRNESSHLEWAKGVAYSVGDVVKVSSVPYICTKAHTSSNTFAEDYDAGSASKSKWSLGNNLGFYTVGLPKNFYGTEKIYLDTSLTSTHVSNAFKSLGLDIYVGEGALGQTDLRTLAESNGIGYSGLIYGTGYPRGFYNLSVDTNPRNLDLIKEGSLYVLSGSGVEPKLYKTIAIKEEEANQYGVVGIEYIADKEEFIEKDIIDTSPSYYVRGPYDVVIKPEKPSAITSTGVYEETGLYFTWNASVSPITGYKVYVSRPDYSTTNEYDSITESYFVPSGTEILTIPINGIYGAYDINVYSQGVQYKLLSTDPASTGVVLLPTPTLSIGGATLTSTIPSGLTIDTADVDSVYYQLTYEGTHSGLGAGNFTSSDVTFRWKYIDPTGGVISTVEQMLENPFVDLPPKITLHVLDQAGNIVDEIKEYQGFSYTITQKQNAKLFSREKDNPRDVEASRYLGLRLTVTDNTNQTKTGTLYAYNILPQYTNIEVIDSYQNSPYYILSGYYGHSTFTGIALWNPQNNTTTGIISGSGVRNWTGGDNYLLRSEDETREVYFEDISGAFLSATGYNGTGIAATATRKGVGINFRGTGEPDYEAYAYAYDDLITHYNTYVNKSIPLAEWAKQHYEENVIGGNNEPRVLPRTKNNPLGIANLSEITAPNTTGFSGIAFTTLTENVSKGEIIFNCYAVTSNKDVYGVDIFTGSSPSFEPDTSEALSNMFMYMPLEKTRAYSNTIALGAGLETGIWYYFKFRPWDDFGEGEMSDVVSGYLEVEPGEPVITKPNTLSLDGGRGENNLIDIHKEASLIRGRKYQIRVLGSNVNWTQIGAESAIVGTEFIYNARTITGSGGFVKRVEVKTTLLPSYLNSIILISLQSDSTLILPSDVPEGSKVIIINRRNQNDLYVEDANRNLISIVRKNDKAELIRDESEWLDPRGDAIYV